MSQTKLILIVGLTTATEPQTESTAVNKPTGETVAPVTESTVPEKEPAENSETPVTVPQKETEKQPETIQTGQLKQIRKPHSHNQICAFLGNNHRQFANSIAKFALVQATR